MHDDTLRDDALARFTDQLLSGNEPTASQEIEKLAGVVRRLHATLPTGDIDPAMRDRLAQRLKLEWDLHYSHARWWQGLPMRRVLVLLAAGLVLVTTAVITLSVRGGEHTGPLQGTSALGPFASLFVIALVFVGIISLLVLFRRSR